MRAIIKAMILHAARALGLFRLAHHLTRHHQRILCYHGIWIGPSPHYGDHLFMSAEKFVRRMAWLERAGYRVIPLSEACKRISHGQPHGKDLVITIDDGWLGTWLHMVPVLERHGFPATLYVTTYYVLKQRPVLNVLIGYLVERATRQPELSETAPGLAPNAPKADIAQALINQVDRLPTLDERWAAVRELGDSFGVDVKTLESTGAFSLMNPEQVRRSRARGVDIQLHTHTHRMHEFDPRLIVDEIDTNRHLLADMLGCQLNELKHFCFPSGEYDAATLSVLRAAGVESATTTRSALNRPGAHLLELHRILDGEQLSTIELEAQLSGFWGLLERLRTWRVAAS